MDSLHESLGVCGLCHDSINDEGLALQCDLCLDYFHLSCCLVSTELLDMKSDKNFSRNVKWLCDGCVRVFAPITQIIMFISSIADRISTLEASTNNLKHNLLLELKTTTQAIISAFTLPEDYSKSQGKPSYPPRHSRLSRRCELNTWGRGGSSIPIPAEGKKLAHNLHNDYATDQGCDPAFYETAVCSSSSHCLTPSDTVVMDTSGLQINSDNGSFDSLSLATAKKGAANLNIRKRLHTQPFKPDSLPVCFPPPSEISIEFERTPPVDHIRTADLIPEINHLQVPTITPLTAGNSENTGFPITANEIIVESNKVVTSPTPNQQQLFTSTASTSQVNSRSNAQSHSNNQIPSFKYKGFKEADQTLIIGTNDSTELQAVPTTLAGARKIFVSRLAPSVDNKKLSDFLIRKGLNARCRQIRTRYPTYSSFCIDVLPSEIDQILSPTFWPKGVLIMPFLGRRNKKRGMGSSVEPEQPPVSNAIIPKATENLQTNVLTQADQLTHPS